MHLPVRVVLLLLASLLAGCQSTRFKVVPVTGKLTYADGKPLPKGTQLKFNPVEGQVSPASGVTEADGSFTLKHSLGRTGAEVGTYIILLAAPEGDRDFYKVIPGSYWEGGALSAEVKEGMGPLDLKVQLR